MRGDALVNGGWRRRGSEEEGEGGGKEAGVRDSEEGRRQQAMEAAATRLGTGRNWEDSTHLFFLSFVKVTGPIGPLWNPSFHSLIWTVHSL